MVPLYNKKGTTEVFYRVQKPRSGTKHLPDHPDTGFLAGACDANLNTQEFKPDDQKSIVEDHSKWSVTQPLSPLISTTTNEEWARRLADKISRTERLTLNQIRIAVICPGLVDSGKMEYYHWMSLVEGLSAEIEAKSRNDHEYVFLRSIPREAIIFDGTIQEYMGRSYESTMAAILRGVSSLAIGQDAQEKESEDEKEKATASGKYGVGAVEGGEDSGVLEESEKEAKAEEKVTQAVNIEAEIAGKERGINKNWIRILCPAPLAVKNREGQKEVRDRSAAGTSDPLVE